MPSTDLTLVSITNRCTTRLTGRTLSHGLGIVVFSSGIALRSRVRLGAHTQRGNLLIVKPSYNASVVTTAPLTFTGIVPRNGVNIVNTSNAKVRRLYSRVTLTKRKVARTVNLNKHSLDHRINNVDTLATLRVLDTSRGDRILTFISGPPTRTIHLGVIGTVGTANGPAITLFLNCAPTITHSRGI